MSDELSGGGALHVLANGGSSPRIRTSECIANSGLALGYRRTFLKSSLTCGFSVGQAWL
jgi:hypothetical protein